MTATRHPACRASGGSCDSRRSWRSCARGAQAMLEPPRDYARPPVFGRHGGRTAVAHETPDVFGGLCNVLFGGETCDPQAVNAVLAGGPPGLEWVRHFRLGGPGVGVRKWFSTAPRPRRGGRRERGPPGVRKFLWDRQLERATYFVSGPPLTSMRWRLYWTSSW